MKSCAALFHAFLLLLPFRSSADLVVDRCVYPDGDAAAQSWVASEGSPPAEMRQLDGKPTLALGCKFAVNLPAGRNYWDRELPLDLKNAEGLQLDIFCRDTGPVSGFTLYVKTGEGWRSHAFAPRRSGAWETVTLHKSEMREEGKPGAWDEITTLRLAAWKGSSTDTVFYIRNLRRFGVLGEDTRILLARNGSDKKDSFAEMLGRLLSELGLRHSFVDESALTPDVLAKAELLILPHNPELPESAVQAIQGYLEKNGRLMAFYSLPRNLYEATGISGLRYLKPEPEGQFSSIHAIKDLFPDAPGEARQSSWNISAPVVIPGRAQVLAEWHDAAGKPTGLPAITASSQVLFMSHVLLDDGGEAKKRLLLAMTGLLRPACWTEVIAEHRARMDSVATFGSYEEAAKTLAGQCRPGSPARQRLEQAARLRADSVKLQENSRFAEALEATDQADRSLREAFCLAQNPKPGEFRAFWCHSAYGVKGMSWDEAIARMKANGFTAIFPNMLWGGVAFYPSEVLPVAETVKEKGDAVQECLTACRKHGLEIHVWKVDWNLGHAVPPAFVEQMRSEGRLQRSFRGEEESWLCPSHPSNLSLERESLLEIARKYPVDGIHFDYIRYPGADHCFCDPCRERFEKATGTAVAKWPEDVRPRGVRRDEWIVWCQGNITALVRTTAEQVRQVRPGIKVSAAVFRNWDVDSRTVMQDWKLWCEKGWLDFVCPMNYTSSNSTFETWVKQQSEWRGPAGLLPGIGASSSHVSMTADQVIGQIDISRRYDTKGFIIFNYGEREAKETLPLLGLGATRP